MNKWVAINDGVDRRIDGKNGYYAEAGPDADGSWSFTILLRPGNGASSIEISRERGPGCGSSDRPTLVSAVQRAAPSSD